MTKMNKKTLKQSLRLHIVESCLIMLPGYYIDKFKSRRAQIDATEHLNPIKSVMCIIWVQSLSKPESGQSRINCIILIPGFRVDTVDITAIVQEEWWTVMVSARQHLVRAEISCNKNKIHS